MTDLLREAPLGQMIRWATKNKYLKYPEEREDFQLPLAYTTMLNASKNETSTTRADTRGTKDRTPQRTLASSTFSSDSESGTASDLERAETVQENPNSYASLNNDVESPPLNRIKSRAETIPYTQDRLEVEQQLSLARTETKPIAPLKTSDGIVLVDWYTTDDPANPQNWSNGKRAFITIVVCLYTFVVYTGSAIYTSSAPELMQKWGLSHVKGSLPLSLYVLAYGVGPLIWAPLSEIPIIGRSPVYASTMALFTIISLPTAMADNFAGLLVLRFLQGFFGSPSLANGAASLQDMYSFLYLPYALVAWVAAAFCGPALGPLLSGFAVMAKGWRWSLWEILWVAGPTFLVMFMLLPETSTPNILLRRAKRLRKLTGNARLQSQSEIEQRSMTASSILADAIVKPIEISLKDPAIAFVNVYMAIIYGIYYSFFEVFPLVYPVYYGFSLGMIGVVFTCVLVACIIAIAIYCAYLNFFLIPDIKKNGLRAQESRLVPALFASIGATIGLFMFGWTARASIHWIVPTIGITIYGASIFIIMQCIFVYVPLSYPKYAASLFAGNDFVRSAFASGSVLFGRPLFVNLGIGEGVSVLGGLSVIGIIGMWGLWVYGAKLRSKNQFNIKSYVSRQGKGSFMVLAFTREPGIK
ncbi:multidrug transporter [Leptodontidium sp. MPI-SDFR-AT-0119]|nr:multidrug transporter [Leptodontidium sp. MPI-SDFR-AT-0119]